jgi:hypothetical protein
MSQNSIYQGSSFHQKFSHLKKGKGEDNSPQSKPLERQKFNLLKNNQPSLSKDNLYELGKSNSIEKKYNNFM